MKNSLLFFALLICMASQSQHSFNYQKDFKKILAQTKTPGNPLQYETLLQRFTANDSTLTSYEVLALMIGFTDQPAYKPYGDLTMERKIYSLNDSREYKKALDSANIFLALHPLSIKVIVEKSYSFHKLGKRDSADYYMYQGRRIFQAMNFSGNGISKATAMFALGPADGQEYIYKVMGTEIGTMGSGSDAHGNFIDMLQVMPEDGKEPYYMYFVIQHATEKMFDGHSIEEELKKQGK